MNIEQNIEKRCNKMRNLKFVELTTCNTLKLSPIGSSNLEMKTVNTTARRTKNSGDRWGVRKGGWGESKGAPNQKILTSELALRYKMLHSENVFAGR